jgi:Na+-driven multidrug efflux pump
MTFMVDTIVAGHFLGADAVAAVALGMPIIGLMLSFTGMILQGGFLKMLDTMGRSDMKDYQRISSLSLTFTLIVNFIFIAICLFGTNGVLQAAGGAKATEAAATMGLLYIRTACMMILFFSLGTIFQMIMATYGYQTDRTVASVVCVVVNVVCSVVFIQLLQGDTKIAGLGIGSALGTLAQTITAYVSMRRRNISVKFRFYPPTKQNLLDSLDTLRRGLPSSIDTMLDSASGSIVNRIILSLFTDGTSVLALVAVVKTLSSLVRTMGRGIFYATEPLVGILHGGRDNEGIRGDGSQGFDGRKVLDGLCRRHIDDFFFF